MIRKILFAVALWTSAVCVFAQSMTDSQIINFVKQEQAKGSNQEAIVTKLLQKGVTPEQLRRLKRKLEAEQQQPGAVDLTSEASMNQGANRQRNRNNRPLTAQERLAQQQNGRMVQSENAFRRSTREEQLEQLNQGVEFLDIDSLVYYQNLLRDESQVFGRNIFNNPNLTFEPSQNIATPANYRLGSGDVVIIDIWGASQQTIQETVSPDGVVVVPGVGHLKLGGLSVQ